MHQKSNKLKRNSIFILFIVAFLACNNKQEKVMTTPWGEDVVLQGAEGESDTPDVVEEDTFDLQQIEQASELIALTISGPETYYDFRGGFLGLHAMLCQQFADSLGVRLRIELCRDTAEMFRRLNAGDGDLLAYPLYRSREDSLGWYIADSKPELKRALANWYSADKLAFVREEEHKLLSLSGRVKRKVYTPMLSQKDGVISKYDGLFQKYSRTVHWDWRLMAAQCYQESTFDPNALSWAGARGLMQIMPQTADHLGLSRSQMFHPEQNIAAAARYLEELESSFSDIKSRSERQKFVLAAYNGGAHHIRDAMTLARIHSDNPNSWHSVSKYVLKLSDPRYYQHPEVKYGYMRGTETVNYVELIIQRYQKYRGVKTFSPASSTPQKSVNKKHREKYKV